MLPLWIAFVAVVVVLLALDLGVFHRDSEIMSTKEAVKWTAIWVGIGVLFGGVVFLIYEQNWYGAGQLANGRTMGGLEASSLYFTAYVLEKSLSVDNIFVISVIFSSLHIAPHHQRRALMWGILGALVFRSIMIVGGVWLIEHVTATFYVFGAILAFSGLRMLFTSEHTETEGWFVRTASRVLPVAKGDYGDRFRAREGGRLMLTRLSVALIAIELTDVVFAFDSVPAVLAISTDPFIVVTSNVFAILGLRSLYFVLASIMGRFHYLQVALSLLLLLIGAKLFLHNLIHIPNLVSIAVVLGVVFVGVGASMLLPPKEHPKHHE